MKQSFFNITKAGFLFFLFSLFLSGCKKENEGGAPVITKIRASTPAPNDSTLTKALPGQTIIIQGSRLNNIARVLINGYPTPFNSAIGTDVNFLVTVPADMPFATLRKEDLNTIKLVNTSGQETVYSFPIVPPAPIVSSVNLEFVGNAGNQRMTIKGNYLYLIDKVIFPGNLQGTNITNTNDGASAEVTIPAGVTQPGGITITTAGGTSSSAPMVVLNDASHVFYDFDAKNGYTSWNNPPKPVVRTSAEPYSAIPFLTGNYMHWQATNVKPGTWWMQDLATPSDGSKLVYPTDITDNEAAANLALKFEINVPGEGLKDGSIEINLGGYKTNWEPAKTGTFKTNGWQTITFPLSDLKNGTSTAAKYSDIKGKAINLFFVNGNGKVTTNVDLGWDNFRIVKVK